MTRKPSVAGCTRVRNGAKYISRWMNQALDICDKIFVLDDDSTDETAEILSDWQRRYPLEIRLISPRKRNPIQTCNILFDAVAKYNPEWLFCSDIDEVIPTKERSLVADLITDCPKDIQGWTFPFYYLWDKKSHYRYEGDYKTCHVIRLFRFNPEHRPPLRSSHATMLSDKVDRRLIRTSNVRMLHYGYLEAKDRQDKFDWYTSRDEDPIDAGAGVSNYDHIIEQNVTLKPFLKRSEWLSLKSSSEFAEVCSVLGAPEKYYIGNRSRPGGFVRIDVLELNSMKDNTVDELYIELDNIAVLTDILKEDLHTCSRVLKPKGRLDINLPKPEPLLNPFLNEIGFENVQDISFEDSHIILSFKSNSKESKYERTQN